MDYKKLFAERFHSEFIKLEMLEKVSLHFRTVEIDCTTLAEPEPKIKYTTLPLYNKLFKECDAGIYYYEVVQGTSNVIWEALSNLKKTKTCSCPKMRGLDSKSNTKILYVGSETKNLARRTMEHFGYAHKDTYALQLSKWAKPISLKLRLHYSPFSDQYLPAIKHAEAAISCHLNPLVGKREI